MFSQKHGIDTDWNQELKEIPKKFTQVSASGAVANNMVVDKSGRVVIFYTEEIGNILKLFYTGSSDNGQTWNQPAPTEFAPSLKTQGNSSLSVDIDENNVVHAIWSSKISKALYYVKASANDFLWTDTVKLAITTKPNFGFSQISCDKKNRVHVYWNEGDTHSKDTAEVFYKRSSNSGENWDNVIQLSRSDQKHSAFPTGDFSGVIGDTLAIAWRDSVGDGNSSSQDWDIEMSVSTDGGVSWSSPFVIAGGSGMQSDPSVVVDKNNIIHVAYHYYPLIGGTLNSQVLYGFSENIGQSWNNSGFQIVSKQNIQSHLVKSAYDFVNDKVWYFYKDQQDYVSPFDKRTDIIAFSVEQKGKVLSELEFISDADSNEVGFHNFKVGGDGIPRAHFFIKPYGEEVTTLFYTQRKSVTNFVQENIQTDKHVFPNPSSELVYFEQNSGEIILWNNIGQRVKSVFNTNHLSVADLPNGIYFLQINGKGFPVQVLH